MEYPDEIAALHAAIIRAARSYVSEHGWAVLGETSRCRDCHVAIWDDEDHAEGCSYNDLREAVNALTEAHATPTR